MARSKLLTREILESYGITNVTEDGKIFVGDKELRQCEYQKKGKYKSQKPYLRVYVTDKSEKIPVVTKKGYKSWIYRTETFLVHRAVYAWHRGEIPEGYEIDHIDTNTLNNRLSNLRLLTKEDNLNRKRVSRNQYNYWMTDEEIIDARIARRYVYDRATGKQVINDPIELALRTEWHNLVNQIKQKKEQRKQIKSVDKVMWQILGGEIDDLTAKKLKIRQFLQK